MDKKKSLNIALIGYGRMGQMIEEIALKRGHHIALKVEAGAEAETVRTSLMEVDVAIEFTQPEAAEANCRLCLEAGVPVVSGTTGWAEGVERLRQRCTELGGTFFWASNFSIGVYLFGEMNRRVARLMQPFTQYRVSLEEIHHIHKLDAPSGTAITLAEGIVDERTDLDGWSLVEDGLAEAGEHKLPISSVREGEVPGTHSVAYTSGVDRIVLRHEAFGREGFALGAVMAAEYSVEHRGALTMVDLVGEH